MTDTNTRYIAVIVSMFTVLIGLLIYIASITSSPSIDDRDVTSVIQTDTLVNDGVRLAIKRTFGEKGYPDKYTYDRPVDIINVEEYDNSWKIAMVEVMDEPPQSINRHLLYILKGDGDTTQSIVSSFFSSEDVVLPDNIPDEVLKGFAGSHD